MAYNICGLKNKINSLDILDFLNKYDLFILIETHVIKDDVNKYDNCFPGYKLLWKPAEKESIFGRAIGGIVLGYKNSVDVTFNI